MASESFLSDPLQAGSSPAERVLGESVLSLAAAARRFPAGRRGRPVHPATLTRWILAGVRRPGGRRVRLEAVRLGGRWVTSREAIGRFVAALTPEPGPTDAPALRSPTARTRASRRADEELRRRGL
jgi:hypothetical protein